MYPTSRSAGAWVRWVNVPHFAVCSRVGPRGQCTPLRGLQSRGPAGSMYPTSRSAGAWARGVCCCAVVNLARFAVQLSHRTLQLKPVFMPSVSRLSVRNSCCARGHDEMDTLLRSPDQHSMQFAMRNKRAKCFGHAGLLSVRTCTVQYNAKWQL